MPRRSSTSNFFSGISPFNHGSNANNLGLVQQNVDSVNHDHHASIGWTGHSSSSVSFRNQIDLEELNAEHGQLPSPVANIGTGETLSEEWHFEPNEDKTLSTGSVTHGPSSAISDAIPQKLDLNVAYEDINENISQEVGSNSTLVNAENYERNTRRRIAPANEQGFPPSSLSSPVRVDDTAQLPNWIAGPSSASVSSVSPTVLAGGSGALRQEEDSQYIPRSTSVQSVLVPGTGWGNPGQNLLPSRNSSRNHSFQNGFTGVQQSSSPEFSPYNVIEGFQIGFTAGVHLSSNLPVFRRRNMAEEYAQMLSTVNRSRMRMASSGSERQITNRLPPSVRGRLESGAGNLRDPRRALMIRDAARNAVVPAFLPISHPLVASHWRATLVQHALEILHSINVATLQYQDGLIVHGSDFDEDDDPEEEDDLDEHLRLDVDDMSYEELLALEDQIGNVNTGLSEEAILAGVGRYRFQAMQLRTPVEEGLCCICQDDYVDGEELGKLDCGHDFHFHCIKRWLIQKNTCPICKTTGVAI